MSQYNLLRDRVRDKGVRIECTIRGFYRINILRSRSKSQVKHVLIYIAVGLKYTSVGKTSANPVRGTLRHTNGTFRMFDPTSRPTSGGALATSLANSDHCHDITPIYSVLSYQIH